MARVAELRETEAIKRLAAEAPPLPQSAVDLLRAAGCPTAQNVGSVKTKPGAA